MSHFIAFVVVSNTDSPRGFDIILFSSENTKAGYNEARFRNDIDTALTDSTILKEIILSSEEYEKRREEINEELSHLQEIENFDSIFEFVVCTPEAVY